MEKDRLFTVHRSKTQDGAKRTIGEKRFANDSDAGGVILTAMLDSKWRATIWADILVPTQISLKGVCGPNLRLVESIT